MSYENGVLGRDRIRKLRERVDGICATVGIEQGRLPFYALAYCLAQPVVTAVITGMSTKEQILANVHSASCRLSPEDLREGLRLTWVRDW